PGHAEAAPPATSSPGFCSRKSIRAFGPPRVGENGFHDRDSELCRPVWLGDWSQEGRKIGRGTDVVGPRSESISTGATPTAAANLVLERLGRIPRTPKIFCSCAPSCEKFKEARGAYFGPRFHRRAEGRKIFRGGRLTSSTRSSRPVVATVSGRAARDRSFGRGPGGPGTSVLLPIRSLRRSSQKEARSTSPPKREVDRAPKVPRPRWSRVVGRDQPATRGDSSRRPWATAGSSLLGIDTPWRGKG